MGRTPGEDCGSLIDTHARVSPTLSRERAADLLTAAATSLPARLLRRPVPPKRLELVYLPYYFFDIEVSGDAGAHRVGVAVDGILAAGVFFIGETLAREPGCYGATCDFVEPASAARETVMQEYRWLLLEHGLRSKRPVSIGEISEPERVYYPFWVSYFKRRGSYDFKALDAVSGEVQGIKMRKVFLAAFRHLDR